ncbi:hypothetical protein LTR66_000296 [Elasticomyces elasticus]|nr:hypothetical protein LTR66_000296 [Elasticomyces elasticus]
MHDLHTYKNCLGDEKHYHDFLVYFQNEIDAKGWQGVLNEYLLAGDERANDMLVRMFAGFFHPIIHLGFGIEFNQPAIIAEALAQAAVHDSWMKPFLIGAEKKAARTPPATSKSIVELLDEVHADPAIRDAPHWEDGNKFRDGILKRVPEAMIGYAAQYSLKPEQLEEKTAEMINASAYFTGAAQHPPKQVKIDFYYMHCFNCSIFFSAFLKQDWLSMENKVRLLEWKSRSDVAMYASRKSPPLLMNEIKNYQPKAPVKDAEDPWADIMERVCRHNDDGHGSKLVRALAHGQQACQPYESKDAFRIKGDMWLQLGHMAIDSVEGPGPEWVRSCGFEQAWEKIEERPRAQL